MSGSQDPVVSQPILGKFIMSMQSTNKGGFANNLPAQLGLLTIMVVILVVVAWAYLW